MKNQIDQTRQVNIWEIASFLGRRWHWLFAGGLAGAIIGYLGYMVLPPKFEASLVMQPARVGSIIAGYANPLVQGVEPEPAALMIERLKLPGFFSATIREQCGVAESVGYQKEMAKDLSVNLIKLQNQNLSLAKISWSAISPEIATDCVVAVFNRVKEVQSEIIAPVIKKLHDQKAVTQREVEQYAAQLNKIDQSLPPRSYDQGSFNQIVVADKAAQNLRESLSEARKRLAEEDAQLLPPYTQPTLMFEPVYASHVPVISSKLAIFIGLISGLFGGVALLLVKHAAANYRPGA